MTRIQYQQQLYCFIICARIYIPVDCNQNSPIYHSPPVPCLCLSLSMCSCVSVFLLLNLRMPDADNFDGFSADNMTRLRSNCRSNAAAAAAAVGLSGAVSDPAARPAARARI